MARPRRFLEFTALLLLTSCASLSAPVKQQLREGNRFVLVRAPTPMIDVPVRPASELQGFLLAPYASTSWVPVNVRSPDGTDPADVLAVALTRRLATLGYAPTLASGVRVRFDSTPEHWPAESGVSARWVLHAQVDRVGLASPGRPRSLRGSATLFGRDGVELRTRCAVDGAWPADVSDSAVWIELLKRCVKELLVPFEEPAVEK